MHLISANSAFDVPLPRDCAPVLRSARQGVRHGVRLLGMGAQAALFSALLWLLAAAPGFLSQRDSLVPVGADRAASQASR